MIAQTNDALHDASPAPAQVSVVVIGLNEGERLKRCLESVTQAHWEQLDYALLYIDSGSTDQSVDFATQAGAQVCELNDPAPSAAKARNLGLRLARGEFIMFLDGDSILDPDFIVHARLAMQDPKLCAVTGHLRESNPQQSIYTKLIDLDWMLPAGSVLFFGGNAFVRRQALLAVGGFDPTLQSGEEPELCARLRAQGWLILHLDVSMARHDLAMTSFRAYWQRAFRSGYGMAEVAHRMHQRGDSLWQYESRRDLTQGLLFLALPAILLLSYVISPWLCLLLLGLGGLALARTVKRCAWKAPDNHMLRWQYALHSFLCKIPSVLGQLAWHRAQRLRNFSSKHEVSDPPNGLGVLTAGLGLPAESPVPVRIRRPRMAYLVSVYPAISHTFILHELEQLRLLGHEILTASINRPDQPGFVQDTCQRLETQRTFYIKAAGFKGALLALAYWSVRPVLLVRMFWFGLRLSITHCSLIGLAYAIEAAILARWMQQNELALLHVHFGNAAATVGVLVKQITGCHLSLSIHGTDEFDEVSRQHLTLKIHEADAVICVSQFVKAVMMRLSPPEQWPKLQLCRLGVDPDIFSFVVRTTQDAPLGILCVGRLIPVKCQVLLVQACAILRDRGQDFSLTFVGAGPDQLRLEQTISRLALSRQVVMAGSLTQQGVLEQLSRADIFVLPSLNEGIPVVLMEAMACGVPCISTPINGIPELIAHNVTGLLATQGDLDALVHQLERLMTDAELRQQLALAARQKILSDFDIHKNVLTLSHIFQSFVLPDPEALLPR